MAGFDFLSLKLNFLDLHLQFRHNDMVREKSDYSIILMTNILQKSDQILFVIQL